MESSIPGTMTGATPARLEASETVNIERQKAWGHVLVQVGDLILDVCCFHCDSHLHVTEE